MEIYETLLEIIDFLLERARDESTDEYLDSEFHEIRMKWVAVKADLSQRVEDI